MHPVCEFFWKFVIAAFRIEVHHVEAVKFARLLRPDEYETLIEHYNFN